MYATDSQALCPKAATRGIVLELVSNVRVCILGARVRAICAFVSKARITLCLFIVFLCCERFRCFTADLLYVENSFAG